MLYMFKFCSLLNRTWVNPDTWKQFEPGPTPFVLIQAVFSMLRMWFRDWELVIQLQLLYCWKLCRTTALSPSDVKLNAFRAGRINWWHPRRGTTPAVPRTKVPRQENSFRCSGRSGSKCLRISCNYPHSTKSKSARAKLGRLLIFDFDEPDLHFDVRSYICRDDPDLI